MEWLNIGNLLIINPSDNDKPKVVENIIETSDLPENDFYTQCQSIFHNLNKSSNPISKIEASNQYAKLFKERSNQQFSFSLCFLLLPICFFDKKTSSSEDFRYKLVEILQLTEPPKNICSQLLYYLAIKNENFEKYFDRNGGTEPARKLFLQIHECKNIDWWLQELLLYSTNLFASDFDKEMINYVTENDKIECGNFLQTMILTLFYHLLFINRNSIVYYAKENIRPNNSSENFVYSIITSDHEQFLKNVYNVSQSSLFSVHFLNLIKKEMSEISQEYQLAVLRYVELLSSQEQYRPLIPDYMKTIISSKQNVSQALQNVLPSLINDIPDIIKEANQLESFEKEYSLKSIQTLYRIDEMNDDSITEFLNENFLDTNRKTKLDVMKAVVDYPIEKTGTNKLEVLNDDGNEQDAKGESNEKSKANKLKDLKDVKGSVIVGMIESYLDVDYKEDESRFLEEKLFEFIANNGDIPEYGK